MSPPSKKRQAIPLNTEEDICNPVVEESKEDTGAADTTESKANHSLHGIVNASKTETVR